MSLADLRMSYMSDKADLEKSLASSEEKLAYVNCRIK